MARRITIATCAKPVEIEALLADSLTPVDKARAKSHLAECETCRKELHEKRRQDDLFREVQQAYADSATAPGVRDAELQSLASIHDSIEGYEVLSEVHRGGQGVVYKAVQQATKRTVALKVLLEGPYASAKQRHRFEFEIDVVAGLQHPNIVTVYDSGVTSDRRHYFAMEYVHGQPLDAYLSEASLSVDETLRLFQKICSAVSYAHRRGVIHRDLKPDNIRIDAEGEPHVLDFGLAKAADSGLQGGPSVTVTGEFLGTLAYASPEQTKGDAHLIDIRTDVYSLGVVLYEMLTSKYPYEVVGQMTDVLRNIAEAEPKKPSTVRRQINDEVETIVLKALAKERERRYQSAETLARDIEHYLNGEPIDAKRDSTWYVIRKSMQRHRVAAGVALGFVLLLGVSTIALSIMYQNQSRAREEAESAREVADQARTSEEQQRKLAEQRANELQTVTEFQQSMLGGIDAAKMGRGIMAALHEGIREGLGKRDISPQEVETSMASFARLIGEVNATNLALNIVDENVLSRAVEAIDKDFADQPMIHASLQQTVADTYTEIGLYEPATLLQEASLRTRRSVLGDDHSDTLTSINSMGYLLKSMGKYKEALLYYREALEGRRRVLGDDDPDTLTSINSMGVVLKSMGRHEEVMPYFDEALQGKRRVLGDDHPSTLLSINSMGTLLRSMGKYQGALPYLREALEGYRRVLGDDHPNTLSSLNSMAILLRVMGKLDEAEPYLREALEGYRRVLGDDHPHTLTSINNMGTLLGDMGKLDEVEPYVREALEGYRRVLGDDHPNTLHSIYNMGSLLRDMGKLDEAEPYLREALEGYSRVLGDDHPSTLISINSMGGLLFLKGKYAEAEPYISEALQGKRRVLGDEHRSTLSSISHMGGLLNKLCRHDEAAELLQAGEAAARQVYTGANERRLGSYLATLGEARVGLGEYPAAEKTLLESYALLSAGFGADHERTLKTVNRLIELYDAWHAAEPDKGYAAKASEWRAKLPQPADEEAEAATP